MSKQKIRKPIKIGKANRNNDIHNFYELISDENKREYRNPNILNHLIKIPFRMLIVGSCGSGKTNAALEIIRRMRDTFEKLVICCKSKQEPLYEYLESKVPEGQLEIYEGMENVPPLDKYKNDGQILIIFDDLVAEKNQAPIQDYFIRARKIGGGISCMYLTQSYFKTDKTIRINCNYLLLKKISSRRDISAILSEWALGKDIKELSAIYKHAVTDPLYFLLIDLDAPDERKFRRGFLEFY